MNPYVLSHLKKTFSDHSATLFATLFSMSVVLSCLSLILLARQNMAAMADRWGQDSEITAYLDEDISPSTRVELQKSIGGISQVEKAEYVSKEESARRFLKRMGHLAPDFLQGGEAQENPLPATMDVKIKADLSLSDRVGTLEKVAEKISALSGVSEVSYGQGWLESWSQFLRKFNVFTGAAVAFVLILGLLIIGNATRVSMERRLDEIQVLELVGATASWIRRPFLMEGAVLGLASAVISLVISNFLNEAVIKYFSGSGILWASDAALALSPASILLVLILGLAFGFLGSFLCVRRISTGWLAGEMDVHD